MANPYQLLEKLANEDTFKYKLPSKKGLKVLSESNDDNGKDPVRLNFGKKNKPMRNNYLQSFSVALFIMLTVYSAFGARIKDIAAIEGVSGVQVIGYGLVTGLNNTGDNQQTSFTVQSVANFLKNFGLTVPQINPRIRNVAAVVITATIPPFMKKGSKVDVQVSSIGDATSLQGGVLLMSPILTKEGAQIGMAQGGLSVGGYDYQSMGSRVGRNFVTSGRVPNGLILETPPPTAALGQQINIVLYNPDFTTATNVARGINGLAGMANSASAIDGATIQVNLPAGQPMTQTIAALEGLQVITDVAAKVVINEKDKRATVFVNEDQQPIAIGRGGQNDRLASHLTGYELDIEQATAAPTPAAAGPKKNIEDSLLDAVEEVEETPEA